MADEGDGSEGVSRIEFAVIVASVAFTVLLFSTAVWYAATGPTGVNPSARVTDTQRRGDGVAVTVELVNVGDVGLVQTTVEVTCADRSAQLQFENVPAGGRRTGTVVCPSGGTDPEASVVNWVPE